MKHRYLIAVALTAVTLTGCRGDKDPTVGPLQTKVVSNRKQTVTAGSWETGPSTNLTFRNVLSVAERPRWERALLPKLLHAQTSVEIQVQPGAVACVSEDQTILIPKTRCVTADAQGQSRFDFLETHVAGTHTARLNSTYGLEATTFDTVTIVVLPDVASPNFGPLVWPLQGPPVVVSENAVQDRWGNAVPFRIVSDSVLTSLGDTVGSESARTVTYTPSNVNMPTRYAELRGANNTLVGWLAYSLGGGSDKRLSYQTIGTAKKP